MGSSCSFSEGKRKTFTVSKVLYDAFLNHRGPDVKETVAFALYDSLEERGFRTFLDDQDLQLGDSSEPAIQSAIYSSSVQIAIFSKRYAESPWCLNEPVDMLKTNALFIPVICDVKPSDVRYPDKGVYKNAFAKHGKNGRFSKEKLNDWKAALHSSSLVSGYEFSTSNDNVEMLCSKIALPVQQKVGNTFEGFPRYVEDAKLPEAEASAPVKKTSLLPRDSHPVGIDSKFKDMEGLLNNPENEVIAIVDCKENRALSQLKEVGRGIVNQCGNLPLAIKTTAASLAKTKSLSKWESKRRQLEKAVIQFGEHDPVMDILRLSYDSLPAHLKACFAYLSFSPEDARITCEYLIYLCIGEGFIPAGDEGYGRELVRPTCPAVSASTMGRQYF